MRPRSALLFLIASFHSGCGGPQSALSPGGADAIQLFRLFVVMLIGAIVIWAAINGLFLYATRAKTRPISRKLAEGLIIGGGIVFPVVVLTILLIYGLGIMPDQRAPGDRLRLHVTGEQWWWRVEYWPEGADSPIVSANEVRLPVGARTEVALDAGEVIHSFWVPGLAGKTDMFPGRVTRMSLQPVEAGTYRGQCAEFCGLSHAVMAFNAVAMEERDFHNWLEREGRGLLAEDLIEPGYTIYREQGCGACHTLRGSESQGDVGPDLTHVGGRTSLAAGILPMTAEALARWIAHPDAFKPGAEMPGYDHMEETELMTLASWLEGLE